MVSQNPGCYQREEKVRSCGEARVSKSSSRDRLEEVAVGVPDEDEAANV